tara:strand:- start:3465 stop:5666 length:2202 start_codon:yes stop_codon:yes gene_type:complete
MKLNNLLTILLVFALSLGMMAQHKTTIRADEAFEMRLYSAAIEGYKTAIKKEKDKAVKVRIMYNMAQSYEGFRDYKNAIAWYKKVVSKGKSFVTDHPEVHVKLGNVYKAVENYQDAMDSYKIYSEVKPDDKAGKKGVKSCELAIKWTDNPTRYKLENLRQLNTKYDDAIPAYANKRYNELVYQSYMPGAVGKGENEVSGQAFPDLYYSKLDRKGKWSKPSVLAGDDETGVNTEAAEGSPSFNEKRNTIYFTRCKVAKEKGKESEAIKKTCAIFYSKKKGQAYGEAIQLPFGGDTLIVAHPCLANNDKKIYFVADMPGGLGGKDIWTADYDKKKRSWVNVKNLGSEVNTAGDELYPFVHDDGTFYFSSNGHVGIGGFDIFKVESLKDGWGPVLNMKVPINSSADDIAIIFEDKSERGYLTSNRNGGRGKTDIYSFSLPPMILFVQGVVKDFNTKVILPGATVTMTGSDGSSVEMSADDVGGYKFKLAPNTTYQIQGSSDMTHENQIGVEVLKYFASNKSLVSTIGVEESRTFIQDLELESIPIKDGIELPNIIYAYDSHILLDESKLKLNGLVETMSSNPTLVIELGSHTDFRGSAQYNRKLAQRRAQSAVDYLISKGIEKGRMEAKGYGEDAPKKIDSLYFAKSFAGSYNVPGEEDVAPSASSFSTVTKRGKTVNATVAQQKKSFVVGTILDKATIGKLASEGLREAAHQMNRRTEFKVLRTDYKAGETAQGK